MDKDVKKLKTSDEVSVRELYHNLLDHWNFRNAKDYASVFTTNANLVGFDGSFASSKKEIRNHLSEIFDNHKTDLFIGIIKEVKFIEKNVALVVAHAGMVPRIGKRKAKGRVRDINPRVNTIQTMIATKKDDGDWYISLFQNTPARFHGRPEKVEEFNKELRALLTKI